MGRGQGAENNENMDSVNWSSMCFPNRAQPGGVDKVRNRGPDFIMKDRLTQKLREIEKEVDDYYKSNPLVNLRFATAAWYFLAFGEEEVLKKQNDARETQLIGDASMKPIWAVGPGQLTPQDNSRIADDLINDLKYPMCWLYKDCEQGGRNPYFYNDRFYKASWDLFKLGSEYRWFVAAFTYGSRGVIGLELRGSTIQPTENIYTDMEYEAYNRLIKPQESQEASASVNPDNLHLLRETIGLSLKIDRDRFKYELNSKIIADTITALIRPTLNAIFLLPGEWEFSRYALEDFRKVFETISAIACIHATARRMATNRGGIRKGYVDSIHLRPFDRLLRQVVRYSGVSELKVQGIFDDLSYGNGDISDLDPALQPLIKLNSEVYAIMPHLWLFSAAERNLTVLLNRLSSQKEIYSKLVDEKEEIMRRRFITGLPKVFRSICGRVADLLPDIDLAIISDSEKTCLLLELKWFIYPAEAREVIEKSKEIEKGISQLRKLKDAFVNNHKPFFEKLNIDSSYRLEGVVVSENWIGHATVQSSEIPVIQAAHLIEKLRCTDSLESVMEWLKARKYLPTEGEHFEVHRFNATIGNWSLGWHGIQPLIRDAFFPL